MPIEDLIQELCNFPELQELTPSELMQSRMLSKSHGGNAKNPFSEMLIQISTLMGQAWMPSAIRREFIALSNNFGGWEGRVEDGNEIFCREVIEFYKTHRNEILAAKAKQP